MSLTVYGYQGSGTLFQVGYLQGMEMGQTLPAPGKAIWIVKAGASIKNLMSSSTIAFGVWATGTTPGALLGTTDRYALTFSADAFTTRRAMQAPVLIASNQKFTIGHNILGTASGDINDWFALFDNSGYPSYSRGPVVNGLQDPFGTATDTNHPGLRVWVYAQANRSPDRPTNVAPADGTVVTTGTPTFTGTFSDPDEIIYDTDNSTVLFNVGQADKLKAYQIRVVNNATGAQSWSSGVVQANSSQQAARQFSQVCGTTLAGGVYTLHIKVQDQANAWSSESSTTFTVSVATGAMTAPTGTIFSTSPSYTGKYTATGGNTANQYMMRLLRNGGEIDRSAAIATSLANGASITASTATLGFPTLTNGVNYQVQVMFRYSASNIWTDWSDALSFRVNGAPAKPTNLSPNGDSYGRPAYPTLKGKVTDSDDADDQLAVTTEVTRPDSSTINLVNPTYNYSTGQWEQTTGPTTIPAGNDGVYQFRMKGTDPHGLVGPWSDYATFGIGNFPAITNVTVTPTDGVNITGAPVTFTWQTDGTSTPTSDQQASRVITIYDPAGVAVLVSDHPFQTTTYTTSNTIWEKNNTTYTYTIAVTDSAGLTGTYSGSFHVQYTVPAAITPTASPVSSSWETLDQASMTQLTWDASIVDPSIFNNYTVWRWSGVDWVALAKITDQSQTTYLDRIPPSGAVIYAVTQETQVNEASLRSDYVQETITLSFAGTILTDVFSNAPEGITFMFGNDDGGRQETIDPDVTFMPSWDAPPTGLQGGRSARQFQFTATIPPDVWLQTNGLPGHDQYVQAFRDLVPARRDNSNRLVPRILCYRDSRNRRAFVMTSSAPTITDNFKFMTTDISISLQEVSYQEGIL